MGAQVFSKPVPIVISVGTVIEIAVKSKLVVIERVYVTPVAKTTEELDATVLLIKALVLEVKT